MVGGLEIGVGVGIVFGVRILISLYEEFGVFMSIMEGVICFAFVSIGEGLDFGISCIVFFGVRIGKGVQVGVGVVVSRDLFDFVVVVGVFA